MAALLEAAGTVAGLDVFDVAEDRGHEHRGLVAPPWPGDVDLAGAAHAVPVEVCPKGLARSRSARQIRQFVEEGVALRAFFGDAVQKRHNVSVRSDGVGDVEERQPHLRGDVVGDRLRKYVGGALLTQSRFEMFVEPPRRFESGHDDLGAPRIEQDPLQLGEVGQDEVKER